MSTATSISNPFVWAMIIVVVLLIIVIKSLTAVLLSAARNSWAKKSAAIKAQREPQGTGTLAVVLGLLLVGSLIMSTPALADEGSDAAISSNSATGTAAAAAPLVNGVSDTAFYVIISVIGLEILVILYLVHNINILQHEADQDMGREHDGVREPDNKLPLSWRYGLYAMTIFAVIYIWRYHVSHSAAPSGEGYAIAVQQAKVAQEANLKNAANSVDENTVKQLTSPADLAAGKAIFQTICFACHGMNGEGSVGPNLTDRYWLHGGTIQDIFKTIKYGYPEKGMKSWKDDYSPMQIAQISSYVKSLAGTNPPNAKAPQGELAK